MITSIDAEKAFNKIKKPINKKSQQMRNRSSLLQLDKGYLPKNLQLTYLTVRNLKSSHQDEVQD